MFNILQLKYRYFLLIQYRCMMSLGRRRLDFIYFCASSFLYVYLVGYVRFSYTYAGRFA